MNARARHGGTVIYHPHPQSIPLTLDPSVDRRAPERINEDRADPGRRKTDIRAESASGQVKSDPTSRSADDLGDDHEDDRDHEGGEP